MKIRVKSIAQELRHSNNGKEYTSLMTEEGEWINIFGNHLNKKGSVLNISEPKYFGKTKWASVQKEETQGSEISPPERLPQKTPPQESVVPTEIVSSGQKTLADYIRILLLLNGTVKTIESGSPEARAMLINAGLAAWVDGKIIEK
jgi:hypothetical protein